MVDFSVCGSSFQISTRTPSTSSASTSSASCAAFALSCTGVSPSPQGLLCRLPSVLLVKLLNFLQPEEVGISANVCRGWKYLQDPVQNPAQHQCIWKEQCKIHGVVTTNPAIREVLGLLESDQVPGGKFDTHLLTIIGEYDSDIDNSKRNQPPLGFYRDQFVDPTPPTLFGKKQFEYYFGLKVDAPRLHSRIYRILQSPCPFFRGFRVEQTHTFTLLFKGLTINNIEGIVNKPKQVGHVSKYNYKYVGDHGDVPVAVSRTVLMTYTVIPRSRNKSADAQQALVAPHAHLGYRKPRAVEAIMSIFSEHVRLRNSAYAENPITLTSTLDSVDGYPLCVGALGAAGLDIYDPFCDNGSVGVAALREF